ncbi:hypothetical protein PF049_00260 [Erythrobacteraceae bacterium WH01K]|nr:hypothetical protein PF049_00260 [Erythrobacteraceae bacterium WH01K]
MNWNVPPDFDPSPYEGFVYSITSKSTGRFYIGKKSFWARRGKGKKQVVKHSNWKTYKSSCKELKEAIAADPTDWEYEILHYARDKRSLTYLEVKEQMIHEVLERTLPDGTRLAYNGNIAGKFYSGRTSSDSIDSKTKARSFPAKYLYRFSF